MSEQGQFIRIPWHIILEVCSFYRLTQAEFDELTWDDFVTLYWLLRRGLS